MADYWTDGAEGVDEVRVIDMGDDTVVLCQRNEATGHWERVVAGGLLGRLVADWIGRAGAPRSMASA